jgi:hypothetical protein
MRRVRLQRLEPAYLSCGCENGLRAVTRYVEPDELLEVVD